MVIQRKCIYPRNIHYSYHRSYRQAVITTIAGETGVVYKGVLMECRGQPAQAIALKTLKGLYDIAIHSIINL